MRKIGGFLNVVSRYLTAAGKAGKARRIRPLEDYTFFRIA